MLFFHRFFNINVFAFNINFIFLQMIGDIRYYKFIGHLKDCYVRLLSDYRKLKYLVDVLMFYIYN